MIMEWLELIIAILSGIAACIPLVIKLIDMVQKAQKEKNWQIVVQMVLSMMKEAEQNYTDGADKKSYVISSIKAMERTLQYDIDEQAIGELVDAIIDATKRINIKKK